MKIFKYYLQVVHGYGFINMPEHAKIIKIANQHNSITFWVKVEESNTVISRHFKVVWTGEPFANPIGEYLETVEVNGLMQHIFEIPSGNYEIDEDDFG